MVVCIFYTENEIYNGIAVREFAKAEVMCSVDFSI